MTDKELLKLAAKAAGNKADWDGDGFVVPIPFKHGLINYDAWNPLTNDGDAFRLAVNLRLDLQFFEGGQHVSADRMMTPANWPGADENYGCDILAATRRAIVHAAAEIGKTM